MRISVIHTSVLTLLILLVVACGDFLDERSQNMAYVENVKDLDELLIGEGYLKGGYSLDSADADKLMNWAKITNMGTYYPYIHLMDDDVSEYLSGITSTAEKNYLRLTAARLHGWQPDPFLNSEMNEIQDVNWSNCYKKIAALNSIIFQVKDMQQTEEDKELCNRVEGEAYFLRAQYYFWLANLYGRPYCKATAETDLCIPLKISEGVEDRLFERSFMKEVYWQIVSDLQQATISLRGIIQTTKYRANQAAAFALLSRVYLYMEEYENAIACADSVLQQNYHLLDLNDYQKGTSAVYVKSPETIFTHGPNIMALIHAPVIKSGIYYNSSSYTSSSDLMNCFTSDDLRKNAFFIQRAAPGEGFRCVKMRFKEEEVSDVLAIRLPEVYLNKAEAQALLGLESEARATIQELRAMRFSPENLTQVTQSGEELVNFIRDERRRELCYEGHRWFDLRRYAVNSIYPYTKSIEHVSLASNGGVVYRQGKYVLKPYSEDVAAYVLPIPTYAIDFNEGRLKNEIRVDRELINE